MVKRGRDAPAPTAGAGPTTIKLPSATPLWLHAGPDDNYLLLEDPETGDILLPLLYLKPVLGANYSRKLASLKHRQVAVPHGSPPALADKGGLLHWQWAFEAPAGIKAVVRREMGEDNTPQGHLRLVLAPIVYNAMAQQAELRSLPLFQALHRALRRSTYWPLLLPPVGSIVRELDSHSDVDGAAQLFAGPPSLEGTALKYMFLFKDHEEVELSKKARTTGVAVQQEGMAIVEETVRRAQTPAAALGGLLEGPACPGSCTPPSGQATASAAADGSHLVFSAPPQQPQQFEQLPLSLLPGSVQALSRACTPGVEPALQRTLPPYASAHHSPIGPRQQQQEPGLTLLALRHTLQQELLPVRQQLEALTQEVAALKYSLAQRGGEQRPAWPAPQPGTGQPRQGAEPAAKAAPQALDPVASFGFLLEELKTRGANDATAGQEAAGGGAPADGAAPASAGKLPGRQSPALRSVDLAGPSNLCFNSLGRLLAPSHTNAAAAPAKDAARVEGVGGPAGAPAPAAQALGLAPPSALLAAIRNSINSARGGGGQVSAELARMWDSQASLPLPGQSTLGTLNWSEFLKELQPGVLDAAVLALANSDSQEQQLVQQQ